MRKSFYIYENACKAVNLSKNPQSIDELEQLTIKAAEDGVTIIAIDTIKNKVVGAAFNKLQVKNKPGETNFFTSFANSLKTSQARAIIKFMNDVDDLCNLFDYCQVDCLLEIMFLAVLPEYGCRGIGKELCKLSIEIAKQLSKGINVKKPLQKDQKFALEPIPKVVSAIFTSFISQKIGKALEFEVATEQSYDLFEFEGKNFSSAIGKETPKTSLQFKKI